MKQPKNSITLALIFSSIILLLVLQFFWLQKVYKDESNDFRRETQGLFRNLIFDMNDSLLMKSIEPMSGDSSMHFFTQKIDTIRLAKGTQIRVRDSVASVQVFISSTGGKDSIERYLRPLVSKMKGDWHQKKFTVRLAPDSLPLTNIREKFEEILATANIHIPFVIKRANAEMAFPPRRVMMSDEAIVTPTGGYQVEFPDQATLIYKKISPQIAFSIFLTLLTAGSFFLLFRSLKAQQRLMELKNDFISNITHELKTPVTTVGVAIEALKSFKGLDNPKLTQEYLDIAQNELNRLSILTDKILKTAIFENKGVDFQPEVLEMDKLVEQVLSSMKLVFEKQHAKIHFEKVGSDFHLNGGSVHLTSVVYNLLDNALKYSVGNPEISIVLTEKQDHLILTVKDNGIGIAHEDRKKVFEKFFRVPTGDVHNIKGYGLGLSYVESVVKSHKGQIELDSDIGKGSCFKITLPK